MHPIHQRLQTALEEGEGIHPGYANELHHDTGVTVAWEKIPYSLGGWMRWTEEAREKAYPVLTQPDGSIYFAGEHLSYLTGWQEGAILSALEAVKGISAKLQEMRA